MTKTLRGAFRSIECRKLTFCARELVTKIRQVCSDWRATGRADVNRDREFMDDQHSAKGRGSVPATIQAHEDFTDPWSSQHPDRGRKSLTQ